MTKHNKRREIVSQFQQVVFTLTPPKADPEVTAKVDACVNRLMSEAQTEVNDRYTSPLTWK